MGVPEMRIHDTMLIAVIRVTQDVRYGRVSEREGE
jgi:hypothetical protein